MQPGRQPVGQETAGKTCKDTKDKAEKYIRGIVYIQIKAGESDTGRQDQSRYAKTPVVFHNGSCRSKRGKGMA